MQSPNIKIGEIIIGKSSRPKIIAEAGVSHFGSMSKLQDLVDFAARARADFFKIQHFDASKLINASDSEWLERLRPKEVSNDFIKEAKQYCDEKNIEFLCTGHDEESLEFLFKENLVRAVKIGSGERGNNRLFDLAIASGLPLIISLGMYEQAHVNRLCNYLEKKNKKDVILLHCVTSYPTEPKDANICYVKTLSESCNFLAGYSDHTVGITFSLAAVALGARLIEKHIALDFNVPNAQDWKVSSDEAELKQLCTQVDNLFQGMTSTAEKATNGPEIKSKIWALKSPYYSCNLAPGDKVREEHIVIQRPFTGVDPSDAEQKIGKPLTKDVKAGAPLSDEDFY